MQAHQKAIGILTFFYVVDGDNKHERPLAHSNCNQLHIGWLVVRVIRVILWVEGIGAPIIDA